MAPPRKKRTGNPAPRRKTGRRPTNSAAANTKPSSKSLSDLLSLNSIGDLRNKTKQWLQYLQQADRVLDTLYVAGNSMNESGLLQKIIKSKGKDLSTGDLASILSALVNTPLAEHFFKGWGGGDAETPAQSAQQSNPELPAGANGPQGPTGPQQPGAIQGSPGVPPYGSPQYPYQPPPYPQQYQQHPYQPQYPQQYQQAPPHYYQQPPGQPPGLPPGQPSSQSQANYQNYQAPPISLLNAPPGYSPYYSSPPSREAFPGSKKKTAK